MEQQRILLIYPENYKNLSADCFKANQLSTEENTNLKIQFIEFYFQNTQTVNFYNDFCHDAAYSNFCKVCFKQFKQGEEMRVDCISCKIGFHYVKYIYLTVKFQLELLF